MSMVRLLIALLLFPWLGTILCDDDEQVLLALKQGITDGSGVMNNWISGTSYCNWTGIQCDPDHPNRVESITLSNKLLAGTITPLVGHLQYLKILNMEINNLTGSIPSSLENCSYLTNISLGSNQLSGIIPVHLDRCHGFQRLDVWNNQLEGTIPASLGNCSMIDYLSLGQNFLTGSIPSELGNLSRLKILRLFTNGFVGSFPTFLTNCTQIQIISLRNNSLTGSIPKEVQKWTVLQQLRIQSNFFEGTIPPEIGNMTSLYYIDISSNKLTGNIPSTFGSLKFLQELYLNNNSLTGGIPEELLNCQNLGTLDLSHNQLDSPLLDNIGNFQKLTNLTLDHNLITGRIPNSIGKLGLINLDFSHNRLTGSLPSGLASLTNIQIAFNLAYNSLNGSIPSWIGNFKVVEKILLQSNNFSGEIPTNLGQCVGLQVLDLSFNKLTGEIPSSLTSLKYLTSLNLSSNQLDGEIPTDGSFYLFNATSFEGNPGLCGAVINRSCTGGSSSKLSTKVKKIVIIVSVVGFCCLLIIVIAIWLKFRCCFQPRSVRQPTGIARTKSHVSELPGPLITFSPQELEAMTENYAESNLIGVGGFSKVYSGKLSKALVAVKLMRIDTNNEVRKSFFAEIQTLGQVKHRNLLRLQGYCLTMDIMALVLDYMPNGSLEHLLKEGSLNWNQRFKIAVGVAQGMAYLHHEFHSPIIHCDLKPANILLDMDFEPHVADFGISKIAHLDQHASISAFRGSIGYSAPEYGTSSSVTTKGDVYSYGIVLLELLTGKSPTSGMFGVMTNLQEWVQDAVPSRIADVIDPKLEPSGEAFELEMRPMTDLALLCISYNPTMRPTMKECLATLVNLSQQRTFPPLEYLMNAPSPYIPLNWRLKE